MNRVNHFDSETGNTNGRGYEEKRNSHVVGESRTRIKVKPTRSSEKQDKYCLFKKTPSLTTRIRNKHVDGKNQQMEKESSRQNCKIACKSFGSMFILWASSLRSIEGHQGTGVVSYFVLLRWLFGLNTALFIVCFIFLNVPVIFFPNQPLVDASIQTCSNNYIVQVSSDVFQLILDFFSGSGWLEKSELFYGYYSPTNVDIFGFNYNAPLAYILVIVSCLLLSLFLMARYSLKAFQESMLSGVTNSLPYCMMIFCSWDYSLTDHHMAEIKSRKFKNAVHSDIQEQKFLNERQQKMKKVCSKCALYTVRLLINILVVACLAGAGCAIYYASDFSSRWTSENNASNSNGFLVFVIKLLPSLVITVLNAVLPLLFEVVVTAEQYTQTFVIKLTLIRTVFLKLSSLAILIVSVFKEVISCETKDTCGTNVGDCPKVVCWETYVGQELYRLVIIDFLATVGKVFLFEFPRRLLANKCSWKIIKLVGAAEFNVAANVLDLVYGQSICWLGLFFSPLFPAIFVLRLFIIFYVKQLSALFACEPPNRRYRATRTNSFFMAILILALFICCFPVIYAMSNVNSSKVCGPFSLYDFPYLTIPTAVFTLPNGAWIFWNIITSPAVTASCIIMLMVVLYFCSNIRGAHKKRNHVLREKFKQEYEEKRMLIIQYRNEFGAGRI